MTNLLNNRVACLVSGKRADLYAAQVGANGERGHLYHFAKLSGGQLFYEIEPVKSISGKEWVCVIKCAADAQILPSDSDASDLQQEFELFVNELEDNETYERLSLNIKKLGAKEMLGSAMKTLSGINEKLTRLSEEDNEDESEAVRLCGFLCRRLKISLKVPSGSMAQDDNRLINEILYLSGVRYRKAILGDRWWKNESGTLLAAMTDGTPVVLFPHFISGYCMYSARDGKTIRVTAEIAARVNPEVKSVYRTLPARKLSLKDLVFFMFGEHIYIDIAKILFFCMLAAFVQILPPIVSARIFDMVIPGALRGLLWEMIFILLAFETADIGFSILTNMGLSRINTKLDISLQAAVWDRLLGLKVVFLRRFSTSDLLGRIKGLNQVRQTLTPDLMKTILSALFSCVNIYVLFVYNGKIAPYVLLVFLIAFLVSALAWWYKYKINTAFSSVLGKSVNINNQIINNIERVKLFAAEERVFNVWSKNEAELRFLQGRAKLADHFLSAFYIFYQFASTAVVYLLIFLQGANSTGSFIAFISSFLIFQKALMKLLKTAGVFPEIVPLLKNIAPLFAAEPEYGGQQSVLNDMDGSIEFNHVSFQYPQNARMALKDVSFKLTPGQSLGIIGVSGSGKSTLLRLLLGFYDLTEGKIYVGGYDLSRIDLRYLRRHMGVVLQDARLVAGTIYENITDNDPNVTEDDLLDAIRIAKFQNEVNVLPQGLYTKLEPNDNILSEGQKQKLLIARALAKKQHYILLDESTSSLDSITQSEIMRNISKISATKIIIAQRLSTVRYCDKIVVIDGGHIVKEGTYDEIVGE